MSKAIGVNEMTLIIGLTGSIASGKSTVSAMFSELDIPVVDADQIARVVVQPGEKAYREIVAAFSHTILHSDNTIDRSRLGSIVFEDGDKRKQLNAIVHPEVRKKMLQERDTYIESGYRCVVLDIPLLFESKLTHFVDTTIVVFVEETIQLKRLMEREGYSKSESSQRIRSQIPMDDKKLLADVVLDNNGTKEQTFDQLQNYLVEQRII